MLPRIITSWDDGDPQDIRIALMLNKYELPGIFFWPVKAVANKPVWAREIAKRFEIGAHTVNHVHLTAVDYETAANEIIDGKEWLENAYGKPIEWFCYPRGRYSPDVLKLVDEAGYKYARTTKVGNWDGKPGLEIRADIHCFNRKEYDGIPWLEYALTSWENAKANNFPTFHIWGHSHEINKYDDWFNLETLFKKIFEDYHKASV